MEASVEVAAAKVALPDLGDKPARTTPTSPTKTHKLDSQIIVVYQVAERNMPKRPDRQQQSAAIRERA